ncbi:hypothetical protein L7F22_029460 [Adiantum nelumboides]|nr:hypothetical protein [Adiantum nelumboides]
MRRAPAPLCLGHRRKMQKASALASEPLALPHHRQWVFNFIASMDVGWCHCAAWWLALVSKEDRFARASSLTFGFSPTARPSFAQTVNKGHSFPPKANPKHVYGDGSIAQGNPSSSTSPGTFLQPNLHIYNVWEDQNAFEPHMAQWTSNPHPASAKVTQLPGSTQNKNDPSRKTPGPENSPPSPGSNGDAHFQDEESVIIDTKELEAWYEQLQDKVLIGLCHGPRPPIEVLKQWMHKNWDSKNCRVIQVQYLPNNYYMFYFDKPESALHVLHQGRWILRSTPFLFYRWYLGFNPKGEKPSKVPIWVDFHDLPIELYPWLRQIGLQFGRVLGEKARGDN